jgi:calpain family cysteine protease/hemolysin type calcium-binding protein
MWTLLTRAFGSEPDHACRRGRKPSSSRLRPSLEGLEVRDLKSMMAMPRDGDGGGGGGWPPPDDPPPDPPSGPQMVECAIYGSTLAVSGTPRDDVVQVYDGGNGWVYVDTFSGGDAAHKIWGFEGARVGLVTFGGGESSDRFVNNTGVTSRLYGGPGDDTLYGGWSVDWIYGDVGSDYLVGNGGNNKIFGGVDFDTLIAGTGTDFLDGGFENDSLFRGGGNYFYNALSPAIRGASSADINQTGAATCSFLASLSGVARTGYNFADRISYLGNGRYEVSLYYDAGWWAGGVQLRNYQVDFVGDVTDLDPVSDDEGEFWTILFQRAYIQQIGQEASNPDRALLSLTGHAAEEQRPWFGGDFGDEHLGKIRDALSANLAVIAGTEHDPSNLSSAQLVANHAYTVVGVVYKSADDRYYITLRNPWGHDGPEAYGDPSDGIVRISWENFRRSMQGYWIQG